MFFKDIFYAHIIKTFYSILVLFMLIYTYCIINN